MILVPDDEVIDVAKAFLGSPFHHAGRNPKVGIDCAGLIIAVGDVVGCHITGPLDYQPRGDFSAMMSELSAQLAKTDRPDNTPGNIISISSRLAAAHCAIVIDHGRIIHAIQGRGTVIDSFARYEKHITGAWRYQHGN
jgi:cell wall-associated NlpC family hydrolase